MKRIACTLCSLLVFIVASIAFLNGSRVVPVGHSPINVLQFVDAEIGWMIGEDGLFGTEDGGHTWHSINAGLDALKPGRHNPLGLISGFVQD